MDKKMGVGVYDCAGTIHADWQAGQVFAVGPGITAANGVLDIAPSFTPAAQRKAETAMDDLMRALPWAIADKITSYEFNTHDRAFSVRFGEKVIRFENSENFPTASDIARVALECP